MRDGIKNPIDRLSATYAIGKLIEVFEEKRKVTQKDTRLKIVDELFYCFGKVLDMCNEKYSWDETHGIICDSREDADEIANIFDDMYDCGTCAVGNYYGERYFVRNF